MLRGEIDWVDFGINRGSVQSGRRPGLVIQNDTLSNSVTTRLVVPLTSSMRMARYDGTAFVPMTARNGLRVDSLALAFQTTTVDIVEFESFIGLIEPDVLDAIVIALNYAATP